MDIQVWLSAIQGVNEGEVLLAVPAFLLPLAISGISALSGLFSNQKKRAEQASTQTTDQTTMPQYDDQSLYMRNFLMDKYLENIRHNEDMFQGYAQEGLRKINTGSDIAGRAIENILSSRGLGGTSAGVASQVSNQLNRSGQQTSLLNSIPLLADQRRQQNLLSAGQFFSALPKGQRTTGTTTGKGTVTQPSNMLGGLFGGLGSALGGLYGVGAFGRPPGWDKSTGTISNPANIAFPTTPGGGTQYPWEPDNPDYSEYSQGFPYRMS